MQEEIEIYCKVCRKSFKVKYFPTGDGDTFVLENVALKCHYHPRVLRLKKYAEKMLVQDSANGRIFL